MKLTVSQGCFSGSPVAFAAWRLLLAKAAGFGVVTFRIDDTPLLVPDLDVDMLTMENIMGVWETDPEDIILVLLAHCDYEGCIYPNHLIPLADRLEALAENLIDSSDFTYKSPKHLEEVALTRRFAAGLRVAAAANVAVVFECEDM